MPSRLYQVEKFYLADVLALSDFLSFKFTQSQHGDKASKKFDRFFHQYKFLF